MSYRPRFQPQNPALSGDPEGWSSCTAYAAAMAADFDSLGAVRPTGRQVRTLTHDHVGGLNLAEVDMALLDGWGINLDTIYRLPWTEFAKRIDAGQAAILQGGYGPIADSKYDAGRGFRKNHAMLVPADWTSMDPMADGRAPGVYEYHAEVYPKPLLMEFAGELDLGNGNRLGAGHVYASFTRDNVADWHASVAGRHGVYTVVGNVIQEPVAITGPRAKYSADCTQPRLYRWPGHTSQRLVQLTDGGHAGRFIRATHASEV